MSTTSTRQRSGFFFFAFPLVVILGMSPASATTYTYTGKDYTLWIAPIYFIDVCFWVYHVRYHTPSVH